MEIRLAECAGFCFGVKRAVETVYEQLQTGKTIYTYGPIVHNEEVVRELTQRGVHVLEDRRALEALPVPGEGERAVVIICAHGVPEDVYGCIERKGMEVVDATCPFVERIHKIVRERSEAGERIVIAGDPGHPEVEGTVSRCAGAVTVLEELADTEEFRVSGEEKICLVAQTTFNYKKFQDVVEIFQEKGYNVSVVNTICSATQERQRAAALLAAEADVMIVIGGKRSSNTKKLYEICSGRCAHTYYIQTLDDLHLELPKDVRLVGITAGASTPNKLIEEVQNHVRINF